MYSVWLHWFFLYKKGWLGHFILFSGVGEAEFCCVVQAGLGLAMLLLSLPSAGSTVMCDPACPTGLHF